MTVVAIPDACTSVPRLHFDPLLYGKLHVSAWENIRSAAILLRDIVRTSAGLDLVLSDSIARFTAIRDAEGEILPVGRTPRRWHDMTLVLRSPFIAATRLSAEPFWCNAAGIWGHAGKRVMPEVDLSNFVDRTTVRCAIIIPIHLPLAQIGMACLIPRDPGCDDLGAEFEACSDVLALYATRFITSYVETTKAASRLAQAPTLSIREVECLNWASRGKTNDEIGVIVGLSQATVRFHIRNAAVKLDAVNRDQAIFKACQLGYLPPST